MYLFGQKLQHFHISFMWCSVFSYSVVTGVEGLRRSLWRRDSCLTISSIRTFLQWLLVLDIWASPPAQLQCFPKFRNSRKALWICVLFKGASKIYRQYVKIPQSTLLHGEARDSWTTLPCLPRYCWMKLPTQLIRHTNGCNTHTHTHMHTGAVDTTDTTLYINEYV